MPTNLSILFIYKPGYTVATRYCTRQTAYIMMQNPAMMWQKYSRIRHLLIAVVDSIAAFCNWSRV
jgi:hypothetical protein